jgi:hypothetical protein
MERPFCISGKESNSYPIARNNLVPGSLSIRDPEMTEYINRSLPGRSGQAPYIPDV